MISRRFDALQASSLGALPLPPGVSLPVSLLFCIFKLLCRLLYRVGLTAALLNSSLWGNCRVNGEWACFEDPQSRFKVEGFGTSFSVLAVIKCLQVNVGVTNLQNRSVEFGLGIWEIHLMQFMFFSMDHGLLDYNYFFFLEEINFTLIVLLLFNIEDSENHCKRIWWCLHPRWCLRSNIRQGHTLGVSAKEIG